MIPLYTWAGLFPAQPVVFEKTVYLPGIAPSYQRIVTNTEDAELQRSFTLNPPTIPYTGHRNVLMREDVQDAFIKRSIAGLSEAPRDIKGFLHLNGETHEIVFPCVHHIAYDRTSISLFHETENDGPRYVHISAGVFIEITSTVASKHLVRGASLFYVMSVPSSAKTKLDHPEQMQALMARLATTVPWRLCEFTESYKEKVGTVAVKNALLLNVVFLIRSVFESGNRKEFEVRFRTLQRFIDADRFQVTVQRYDAPEVACFVRHALRKLRKKYSCF